MNPLLPLLPDLMGTPAMYAPGTGTIWQDPHIAPCLLETHLDDSSEAASRGSATIDATVRFWLDSGLVRPGMRLLDLGCGPGLYAIRLARAGVRVTGVDFSENSLRYAREAAVREGLEIDYRRMNFLDLEGHGEYDAAIQVYGELNTFSDAARDRLLGAVRASLRPGGIFLFDLSTRVHRRRTGVRNTWYVSDAGFWSAKPHLVLEKDFDFPDASVWCDQYVVTDEDGVRVFRNWFHDYEPEDARSFLTAAGFQPTHIWNDLAGNERVPGGEWFAVCAEAV
ncbi:MAG: methyltransferase domain-containing protein [Clostridia bacterium]|nr:methyltransferase domain-containing protein [Clostridia bacterium]